MKDVEPSREVIRGIIYFNYKQGIKAADCHKAITAVFGDVMHLVSVHSWYAEFKKGRTDLVNEPKSGRPKEVNKELILDAVCENPYLSSVEIAKAHGMSQQTVHRELKNNNFKLMYSRWFCKVLTPDQKSERLRFSDNLLERVKESDFLKNAMATDDTWLSFEEFSTKRIKLENGEMGDEIVADRRKRVKLSVFWSMYGMVSYRILKEEEVIDANLYSDLLMEACINLKDKYSNHMDKIILFQTEARPHSDPKVKETFNENNIETITYPLHALDINPSVYHLFRHLQLYLRNKKFRSLEDLEDGVENFFESKKINFWNEGILDLPRHLLACKNCVGDYVEEKDLLLV